MRLLDLHLTNFRSYRALAHQFSGAPVILVGDNGQGKTNFLEAIVVAATGRSHRTNTDRDLLCWRAFEDDVPACRVVAHIAGGQRVTEVELALAADLAALEVRAPRPSPQRLRLRKRLRINGVPRRASELIGLAAVVLFDPDDIGILAGEPGRRRELLDRALCQLDRDYLRALAQLNRVLPQRNAVLRAIQERRSTLGQLEFWDANLVAAATLVTERRIAWLRAINPTLDELHRSFAGTAESVNLEYRSTIEKYLGETPAAGDALAEQFRRTIDRLRQREVIQGVTLVGPQRDDFTVRLGPVNLHDFGSRGQQRTAAISLRFAEAAHLAERMGSRPLLLLDELFAELDGQRRRRMQELIGGFEQPFITATDLDHLAPALVRSAEVLRIHEGELVRD